MCLDGIVREKDYDTTDPKLLFVAKEPNTSKVFFREEVKYAFTKRLCEWTYVQRRCRERNEWQQTRSTK